MPFGGKVMKIASANIAMESRHFAMTHDVTTANLRSWVGAERPDFEGTRNSPSAQASLPQISDAAKSAQSAEANALAQASDAATNDPFLALIKAMIEWMTGRPIRLFDASQLPGSASSSVVRNSGKVAANAQEQHVPPSAGFGVEYDYHSVHEEAEQTQVSAQGTIQTADGQQISFKLDLSMARSYREESSVSVRIGDAKRRDPLVINFGGTAAQLSDQHFRFDLAGNGATLDVPLLGSNSGFLALDSNGNGKIDSGKELFGPGNGSGFADLARYDADHNGWIDENDPVFKKLLIWTPDAEGKGSLQHLADRNVGALYLGHVGSAFDLRGTGNKDLGAIKDSGIFLTDSGAAGTLQEIDLTA
jgi:hypothetical protein